MIQLLPGGGGGGEGFNPGMAVLATDCTDYTDYTDEKEGSLVCEICERRLPVERDAHALSGNPLQVGQRAAGPRTHAEKQEPEQEKL